MHAAISYYFTQIVDLKRMETCMHNECMGLYGSLTPNIACQQNNEKCPLKKSACVPLGLFTPNRLLGILVRQVQEKLFLDK